MSSLLEILDEHKNNSNDKRVFGLVLQGGGMRGVYSAAAAVPLMTYQVSDAFEHIVGSSAGALNAAYMMVHDLDSYTVYTEDLTNKNFVNLLRRDKKVDIDFLVDTVLRNKRPLDLQKLIEAHGQLHVVVTDAKTGRKKVISEHHQFDQIYEEMRATAALPIFYDKPVYIEGGWYVDGALADLLPIDVAIKLGCTDIVVVMTQQVKNYHFDQRHERLRNHLIRRFAKKQTKAVQKIIPTNEKVLQVNLRRLKHPGNKIKIYLLEPSNAEALLSLWTNDKPKVEALARLGISDMDSMLHRSVT